MVKKITLGIFILSFISYGAFRSAHVFLGEKIEATLSTISKDRYQLEGTLAHPKDITINGTNVPTDLDGKFTYEFSPLPGFNVVTIQTEDKFKNNKTKVYSFIYNNATSSIVSFRTQ